MQKVTMFTMAGCPYCRAAHRWMEELMQEYPEYNDIELEMLDALEHNGQTYMAFCPAVEEGADEDSEDYGMVILKTIEENGEELLSTLDSDEELNAVYDLFMERLFDDEEA